METIAKGYRGLMRRYPYMTARLRWDILVLQAVLLCGFVIPLTSAALRDNDQAAILSGALQLARKEASFWHASFYNYDKQYGTYVLTAGALQLWRKANPVIVGNALQLLLFSIGMFSLVVGPGRYRNTPLWLLLPALLCPALILYAPFLSTATFSFGFILLAFATSGLFRTRTTEPVVYLLLALAAACRGDVVLAVPAFLLAQMPRKVPSRLLRDRRVWWSLTSAIGPVLFGRLIYTQPVRNLAPFFMGKVFAAFIVFALGVGALILMVLLFVAYARLAGQRRGWRWFYALLSASVLIPFVFYSIQLHSPRYFYLTCAVLIFVGCSRRTAALYRAMRARWGGQVRLAVCAITAASVAPWVVGAYAPSLSHIRPTLVHSTTFPTADGRFPMGGYAAFVYKLRVAGQFGVDHNQRIWLSATRVRYETCPDGRVPLLDTPMVNYLELAVRLQNKTPAVLDSWPSGSCAFVYTDARSLTRQQSAGPSRDLSSLLRWQVSVASRDSQSGQPILLVQARGPASEEARLFSELRRYFSGREFEVFFANQATLGDHGTLELTPPYQYVLFSDAIPCSVDTPVGDVSRSGNGARGFLRLAWDWSHERRQSLVRVNCRSAKLWGWAQSVLPPYMSITSR